MHETRMLLQTFQNNTYFKRLINFPYINMSLCVLNCFIFGTIRFVHMCWSFPTFQHLTLGLSTFRPILPTPQVCGGRTQRVDKKRYSPPTSVNKCLPHPVPLHIQLFIYYLGPCSVASSNPNLINRGSVAIHVKNGFSQIAITHTIKVKTPSFRELSAPCFKAHHSGGSPGLSSIVFDEFLTK